jgi:hypothetical protein
MGRLRRIYPFGSAGLEQPADLVDVTSCLKANSSWSINDRAGGRELLRVAKAGDYFGDVGPLFGLPRSATVRARTEGSELAMD